MSEAAFVPLAELATSNESAAFTRAIVPKLAHAEGLHLDSYQPPPDPKDVRAYLLYL